MTDQGKQAHFRQNEIISSTGTAERHLKSQQARNSIIAAAGRKFADRGYAATSLNAIAQGCNMAKGALYFHFQSKQQLAEAVVEEMLTRWVILRAQVAERGLDPLNSLIAEIAEVINLSASDPVLQGGMLLARDTDAIATGASAHFDLGLASALEHLTQAADAGHLRSRVDPAAVARQIIALLTGHRTLAAARASDRALASAMDEAWSLLLPAIATREWLEGPGSLHSQA